MIEDLISLNAITIDENGLIYRTMTQTQIWKKVRMLENILFAINTINENPQITHKNLGNIINNTYDKKWSLETMRVTGGMIYRWAVYLKNVIK